MEPLFIKRTLKAGFDFELRRDDVIVIYDRDEKGAASVTNAIESVLKEIAVKLDKSTLLGYSIIYRDSEKTFDGVALTATDSFSHFYPIGEAHVETALSKIRPH